MQVSALLLLLILSVVASHNIEVKTLPADPLSDEVIDYINSAQSSWKAGKNHHTHESIERAKRRLGVRVQAGAERLPVQTKRRSSSSLPSSFDAREQWSNCTSVSAIRDQGSCGSCWAFAAAEAISDRTCIHSGGTVQVELSPQPFIACCHFCGIGCSGGDPAMAWRYWEYFGLVTGGDADSGEGCQPYDLPPCHGSDCENPTPKCSLKCVNGYNKTYKEDRHFAKSAYSIRSFDVEAIMEEIYTNGPVEASFFVYEDFDYYYTSGVYYNVFGENLGGHAVKILGWGEENGLKYWIVANSWGTDWGMDGFFLMRRGTNECGIEESVVAGIPKY